METDRLLDEFESRQRFRKAESTADRYTRQAKEWTDWLENPGSKEYDDRPASDVKRLWEATEPDIKQFLRQHSRIRGLSGSSIRNRRYTLSTFYSYLTDKAKEGDIPSFENPMDDPDFSDWKVILNEDTLKSQALKEDIYYLEADEVEQLADNAPEPRFRNELIIRLLYQTGMRRGELASTRLEDVNTDAREISVHAEKTHENRTVYYSESLDAQLARWINVERKALATADSEYLFPTVKSDKITSGQVTRTVRKAAERAGIQKDVYTDATGRNHVKITAHTLRHSFAIACVSGEHRMDTRRLQQVLGHASIETTEQYLRFADDDVKDAVRLCGPG